MNARRGSNDRLNAVSAQCIDITLKKNKVMVRMPTNFSSNQCACRFWQYPFERDGNVTGGSTAGSAELGSGQTA
jgi:hypothetical protein